MGWLPLVAARCVDRDVHVPDATQKRRCQAARWLGCDCQVARASCAACGNRCVLRSCHTALWRHGQCRRQRCLGAAVGIPNTGALRALSTRHSPPRADSPQNHTRQFLAAEIESLWACAQGDKWAEVRWWYFPEETHCGRRATDGPHEVFESAHIDENMLDSILHPITVVRTAVLYTTVSQVSQARDNVRL